VPIVREGVGGGGFGDAGERSAWPRHAGSGPRRIVRPCDSACNPPLAYQALAEEPDIGLLLPCNVIVYAADEPGTSVVAVVVPLETFQLAGNESCDRSRSRSGRSWSTC
jgi:hypothetical protein